MLLKQHNKLYKTCNIIELNVLTVIFCVGSVSMGHYLNIVVVPLHVWGERFVVVFLDATKGKQTEPS